MRNDLASAFRQLRTSPGFSILAIVILALGIGPNLAVFSAFDQLILRLLPVENPRELVLIEIDGPQAPGMSAADNMSTVHSYPQYVDYRDRSQVFAGVAARAPMAVLFADGARGERVAGEIVSGNFFQLLGVKAAAGRLFVPEDDETEGAHPVAVLSHRFWVNELGGASDVVGRTVRLNNRPVTIIGVVAPEFKGLLSAGAPSVFMTLAMRKEMLPAFYSFSSIPERMVRHLNVFARLSEGVSLQQAQLQTEGVFKGMLEDELAQFAKHIGDEDEFLNRSLVLTPALQGIHNLKEQLEEPLLVILGLVGLVLLIACVNLAGLMMARSIGRSREMALRTALGADRWRVVRQVMSESLTLAIAGGLAGLLVAAATMELLNSLLGTGSTTLVLDGRALWVTLGLVLLCCPLFGLLPALRASRVDVAPLLREQTAGSGEGRQHTLFRKGAVVLQLALSLCLLVAAGLFARTLMNLSSVDVGFRTEQLLTFDLDAVVSGHDSSGGNALYRQIGEELSRTPGVRRVAAAAFPLLGDTSTGSSLSVEGYQAEDREDIGTKKNLVSPGFFETLGVPVLLGREFEDGDFSRVRKVGVVNETFVRRYFESVDPVGRRISFSGGNKQGDALDVEIVGVVSDLKATTLRREVEPFVFIPYWQESLVPLTFYLLTGPDPMEVGPLARAAVARVDETLPILDMETMAAVRSKRVELEKNVAFLAASLALLATILSALGLYALVAYGVARRRLEIGVRVAFGALKTDVLRLVLKEAAWYLVVGLMIGIPVALALGQTLRSQLFGLDPADPATIAAAVLVLALCVMAAALIPARRAAAIDPAEALRQ